MDPDFLFYELLELLEDIGQHKHKPGLQHISKGALRELAVSSLRDLADWLEKGGAPPYIERAFETPTSVLLNIKERE